MGAKKNEPRSPEIGLADSGGTRAEAKGAAMAMTANTVDVVGCGAMLAVSVVTTLVVSRARMSDGHRGGARV
ncbi:hypothetical protein GUJ93_ZPchr0002g26777 [Zizania palustris]|uniref:Uncharacterized protein n=1 Tax=Zizania palustris TaxID=103762 RepID=A0A8J5SCT8_ZIZPA|nr:hypothetical protein GUJ93_ZPchr0002g26777 [Zizania palustris]